MASDVTGTRSDLEIGPVDPRQAPALRALYEQLLTSAFEALPDGARDAYRNDWSAAVIAQRAADPQRVMLAAHAHNVPLGYVFGSVPEGGVGTIIWLAVAAEARGQRLGRRLVERAADAYRTRGCHKMRLFTSEPGSMSFYRHLGFVLEGEHQRHWWQATFWSLALFL